MAGDSVAAVEGVEAPGTSSTLVAGGEAGDGEALAALSLVVGA